MNDLQGSSTRIFPGPKPVKLTASFWVSVISLSVVVLWIGILPAIFMLKPSDIPPLDQAQTFSGTIDFESAGPRIGSYLIVTDKRGKRMTFSCRKSTGSGHWCLPYEYRGKTAEVWWFEVSTLPGESFKYPIQIVIGDEWRLTRAEALERIRSHRYSKWFLAVFEIVVLVFFIPVWIAVQGSKHAVDNN